MNGLMMQQPLLISSLLMHAERHHGEQELVSRQLDGSRHRQTYRTLASRSRRLARALDGLGLAPQSCVGVMAWNGHRHLELSFAVSGSGRVLHSLNPRLPADALREVLAQVEHQALCFEPGFLPLVEALAPSLAHVRHFILMGERGDMPERCALPGPLCLEDLLDAVEDDGYHWPLLDENRAAALCHSSGTGGPPRGVLYSHRSSVLHTMASVWPDAYDISARDVVLPMVPMFHVNAWGLPYAACLAGARLVLPGPALDGATLHALIEAEQVTLSAGAPTVWQGLLAHMDSHALHFSSMRRTVIGGTACPPTLLRRLQEGLDIQVIHAWGMTETSPLGTVCQLKPAHALLDAQAREIVQARQGRALYGIDIKIVDTDGQELPWDGRSCGELLVRGHWVSSAYLQAPEPAPLHVDAQGRAWFATGDMASIDAEGFMQIADRAKDTIRSGSEWINSVKAEKARLRGTDPPGARRLT